MAEVVVRLAPGTGLLSRRATALLFTTRPETTLVEAFTGAAPGSELQAVASATVAAGFDVGPFVGLSWDGTLRVMAFGDVAVETDQPSLPMLSGAGSRTWVEHTVVADQAVVEVAAADAAPATNLEAGTVLAGGFRLELGPTGTTTPGERPATDAAAGTATDSTTSVPRMEHVAVHPDPATATPPADVSPAGDTKVIDGATDAQRSRRAAPQDPAGATDPVLEPATPDDEHAAPGGVAPAGPEPLQNVAQATFTVIPDPIEIDDDDPVAELAAIQAAAVGPDGQPLEPPGAAPPPPPPVEEHPLEEPDPDATLPPPVSDALLADVRNVEPSGETRGSLVDAKVCGAGHPNPPTAATCAVCSEFLPPGSASVVHVPRPSLGWIQLDDGELVELDQELLIGRNPGRDQDPSRASLRRVKTPGDKVSRSHLEVRFQGWDVLINDCGSTNGTFVVPHPGGQVVALEPGRPQMIDAGAVVYFGSRSFTLLGREERR